MCAVPVMKSRDTTASAFKFGDQADSQWLLQLELTGLQTRGLGCKFGAQKITVLLAVKGVLTQKPPTRSSGPTQLSQPDQETASMDVPSCPLSLSPRFAKQSEK